MSSGIDPYRALQQLNDTLHGFDVQPSAILLTRLRLMIDVSPLLSSLSGIVEGPLFPNVHLSDPLADPTPFWRSTGQFDYVIANPPFSKLAHKGVAFLPRYKEVIYGQPNLYQLFLWWGIQAAKPGGVLAFLVPQSFRSGLYFYKLRQQMAARCNLRSITLFTSRVGVFDGVDSPLMTITLQKRSLSSQDTSNDSVIIHTGSNGNDLQNRIPITVPMERVLRSHSHGPIWCISDRSTDYDILEKVYSNATSLAEIPGHFIAQNGGFVWNQHKEILQAGPGHGIIPLLSASSVRSFRLRFPDINLVEEKRQFALVTPEVAERQQSGRLLLVKRTTPKKRGHRIVAALVPEGFIADHSTFFVENHLNVIKTPSKSSLALLEGLVGWFNSRLLNFVFQMMNGTSHVSIFEMNLLPTPVSWLTKLADITEELSQATASERDALWSALDRQVYDLFNLTSVERERVDFGFAAEVTNG